MPTTSYLNVNGHIQSKYDVEHMELEYMERWDGNDGQKCKSTGIGRPPNPVDCWGPRLNWIETQLCGAKSQRCNAMTHPGFPNLV